MKKELHNELNNYLANTGVLYIKLHNLHWNVVGLNFKSVHEYLETLYDGFAEVLDEVAEAIKMQQEYPLASMKEYLAVATIEEMESKQYSVSDTLSIVNADMATMKAQAEKIREMASEEDNYSVVSMMEGHLEDLNKTLWFLESMMK